MDLDMNFTRRKILLVIWIVSIVLVGLLVARATASIEYGLAASLAILAVSLGVPLMRALTEFSK